MIEPFMRSLLMIIIMTLGEELHLNDVTEGSSWQRAGANQVAYIIILDIN